MAKRVIPMNVFISHASTDSELAYRVAQVLRQAGFGVWDETQILPGESWGQKLAEALQQSDAMVVLLTPDAVRSPNVSHDVGYALGKTNYRGRLIPVLAAPAGQLPEDQIPWILKKLPMISLRNGGREEEGLREIVHALQTGA
jgi:TIR domain-containing protein